MLTSTASEQPPATPPLPHKKAASPELPRNEAALAIMEPQQWQILQSDITSALSYALDLTEDAVPGHAVRSCLLAMRIGKAVGLTDAELRDLYYATLLKDVGCSSVAAHMCEMLGENSRGSRRAVKLLDATRPSLDVLLKVFHEHALPGSHPVRKGMRVVRLGMQRHQANISMIQSRCERGAAILRNVGLGEGCAEAVCGLDEHWDGTGYPRQLSGKAIPVLSRIIGLVQHLDIFGSEFGREEAMEWLRQQSGRQFDPELVETSAQLHAAGGLWTDGTAAVQREMLMALEPGTIAVLTEAEVDSLLEAFASVIDAKSAFTYRHSLGVTTAATGIGRHLGLPEWSIRNLHRAALVHDIGKLGVSNHILDKPGKLDPDEWKIMREHPRHTHDILSRIPAFAEIACTAGRHHERLDGSGYPNQLRAEQLTLHDRILAVADVYGALAEDRPYRKGLPSTKIVEFMSEDVPAKLDERCFGALISYMQELKPFVVAA